MKKLRSDSVCWDCIHCFSDVSFDGGPSIEECEEESDQFMMPEGCWCYEERKEYDDDTY